MDDPARQDIREKRKGERKKEKTTVYGMTPEKAQVRLHRFPISISPSLSFTSPPPQIPLPGKRVPFSIQSQAPTLLTQSRHRHGTDSQHARDQTARTPRRGALVRNSRGNGRPGTARRARSGTRARGRRGASSRRGGERSDDRAGVDEGGACGGGAGGDGDEDGG